MTGLPVAFVEMGEPESLELAEMRLKGEVREVLQDLVGSANGVSHGVNLPGSAGACALPDDRPWR